MTENGDQTASHGKSTKNDSELFTPFRDSQFILIEGIGKTILSKEIAYQWAENNLLQHKTYLFLILLRSLHSTKIRSVEKIVQHVLKGEKMATRSGEKLMESKGKDLVLVLDGYDELPEKDEKTLSLPI